jgi:PAS domain S-box-containing protein
MRSDDLLENAPCGYALLAMDGCVEWANAAFRDLSGLAAGRRFPEALTRAAAIFYETQLVPILILRGQVKEVALDLVRGKNDRIPVFLSGNLLRLPDGTPGGLRIALFEATERRQYERELLASRKSAEQLAEVVRRALDTIITLSPQGTIQAWNSGAEQTFGYSEDEVLGRSFNEVLFPAEAHEEIKGAVARLGNGADFRKDMPGIHKDGQHLDLSLRLTPHLEPPGTLVAFSAIIRDITSRTAAQRALLQSEKLASVGRLASSIAHEINNPLESVTNLLYLIEQQAATPETRHLAAIAQEELRRVSHIVTHTLRFHRQSTNRTETDLRETMQSALELYRARLQNSGITVSFKGKDAPSLLCYEGEIRQILVNLLGNAFDAMKAKGGRLVLCTREAANPSTSQPGVRITVADTGPGIDPSIQLRLFEPFVTTKGITGTGLGLWITSELVRKNFGTIRVRTRTARGASGTIFSLWFPRYPEPTQAP